MKALASERRRFGSRRLQVLRQRPGMAMNRKQLRRLSAEEKRQVRRRGGRKRALGTRRPLIVPDWPNQRWRRDCVRDACTDGRRCRVVTVVDDQTRECWALVVDTSIARRRVARAGRQHCPARSAADGGQ